jgi:cytochrome c
MKKTFIILSLSTLIAACGGSKNGNTSSDSTSANNQGAAAHQSEAVQETTVNKTGAEQTGAATANPNSKGAQLIAKSDCLTCHKEDTKLVGPAYADVAKKYKNDDATVDSLANKVIKGGSGKWGDVPMTPHPQIAVNDAKEMVKYILTLKK